MRQKMNKTYVQNKTGKEALLANPDGRKTLMVRQSSDCMLVEIVESFLNTQERLNIILKYG